MEVTPLEMSEEDPPVLACYPETGQATRLAGGLRAQPRPLHQGTSQEIAKVVFADTFYFLALLNERDAAHPRAVSSAPVLMSGTPHWPAIDFSSNWDDSVIMNFASREDAGQKLAAHLTALGIKADLVLGLPRGGLVSWRRR